MTGHAMTVFDEIIQQMAGMDTREPRKLRDDGPPGELTDAEKYAVLLLRHRPEAPEVQAFVNYIKSELTFSTTEEKMYGNIFERLLRKAKPAF